MRSLVKQVLTVPLLVLAAALVLFEDTVWRWVTGLVAVAARWHLVARLERWVLARGRHATLALFAVPIACLVPVKLAALALIASGHIAAGLLVIVAAKITGTAISARLFVIAKPKLMTFSGFVRAYAAALRFTAWAHHTLDEFGVTQATRQVKAAMRQARERLRPSSVKARNFLADRFRAARRWLRRPT